MRHRMLWLCALCAGGLLIAAQSRDVRALALPAAPKTVLVIADPAIPAPPRHGIAALEDALRAKHVAGSEESAQLATSDVVIQAALAPAAGPQALTIRKGARYRNKPAIALSGGHGVGLM